MYTLIPLPDILDSVLCLSDDDLNLQRKHIFQLVDTMEHIQNIASDGAFWERHALLPAARNRWHPCMHMWYRYHEALKLMHNACIVTWRKRGHTCTRNIVPIDASQLQMPHWLGIEELHSNHRGVLVGTGNELYTQKYKWDEEPQRYRIWPISWPKAA